MNESKTAQDVLNLYTKLGLGPNFCPVPFTSAVFEADGSVCLCRQKGNFFSYGNINDHSFQEIWNNSKIQSIRKEFLDGAIKTCASEIAADKCNLNPSRLDLMEHLELTAFQKNTPVKISPNFNGQCNLSCPMCRVWEQENGLYDKVKFWDKLQTDLLPHLTEIDSFSGEPFVQKDTYRLIHLSHQINSKILWSFTTNGQWTFNSYVQRHLDLIKIKHFTFSLDTLDSSIFSMIRKNGNLQKTLACIVAVHNYNSQIGSVDRRFRIGINMTVQILNWKSLPDVIMYAQDHDFLLNIRLLTEPSKLSILSLSRFEMFDFLNSLLELNLDLAAIAPVVKPILKKLELAQQKMIYAKLFSLQTVKTDFEKTDLGQI